MTHRPRTPEEYLVALDADRRAALQPVRDTILANLPEGYVEALNWGGISYEIPLSRYPKTYNKQPLMYAALAPQKSYNALYLMAPYQDPAQHEWLAEQFAKAGKRLDMGKSCLRFRDPADLPLEAIGELIASTTPDRFIVLHEAARRRVQNG